MDWEGGPPLQLQLGSHLGPADIGPLMLFFLFGAVFSSQADKSSGIGKKKGQILVEKRDDVAPPTSFPTRRLPFSSLAPPLPQIELSVSWDGNVGGFDSGFVFEFEVLRRCSSPQVFFAAADAPSTR